MKLYYRVLNPLLSRSHRASHFFHRQLATHTTTSTAEESTNSNNILSVENDLREAYQSLSKLLNTDSKVCTTATDTLSAQSSSTLAKLRDMFQEIELDTNSYEPKHAHFFLKVWEKTILHSPNETLDSVEQYLPKINCIEERSRISQKLSLANVPDANKLENEELIHTIQTGLDELSKFKELLSEHIGSDLNSYDMQVQDKVRELLSTVNDIWCYLASTQGRATSLVQPNLIKLSMQVLEECSYSTAFEKVDFIHNTLFNYIPEIVQPIELHNMYIAALLKSGSIDNGVKHLKMLQEKQTPKPNLITYSIVLKSLYFMKSDKKYSDIMEILNNSILSINWNGAIDVTGKKSKQIIAKDQMIRIVRKARIRLNSSNDTIYNTAISECKDGWVWLNTINKKYINLSDIKKVLEYQLQKIQPLNDGGGEQKQQQKTSFYQKSNGLENLVDHSSFYEFQKNPWWSTQVEKTLKCIIDINNEKLKNNESSSPTLKIDTVTCNLLLKGCALSRDIECAKKIWEDIIVKHNTLPDQYTKHYLMESVLNSFGSIHDIQHYWYLTSNMLPRFDTMHKVLKFIVKKKGVHGGAQFLNIQISKHNIKPDIKTINILLNGCSKDGQVGAAYSLLNGAIDTWNVMPDVVSYTILIQCYCRMNDPVGAYSAFKQMLRNDIIPDNIACAKMVQTFAEFGEENAASHFLFQAKSNGWINHETMIKLEDYVASFDEVEDYVGSFDEMEEVDDGVFEEEHDDEYYDSDDNHLMNVRNNNILVPLPGEDILHVTRNRDEWLLNEISTLTPGTTESKKINDEKYDSQHAHSRNDLRLLFEDGYIKVIEIENCQ